MGSLFNLDNPIMVFLGKVADLIILNIIAILCCIPVVTAGASFTALYYVTLKMVKKEEGYIIKGFFKSFKENFKQSTVIWLIALVLGIIFCADIYILNHTQASFTKYLYVAVCAVGIFYIFTVLYVFPVLSRFDNSIKNTVKNAFLMSILSAPKTILMVVIQMLPLAAVWFIPASVPIVIMLGLSLPAYLCSMLFVGIFKKFEPKEEEDDGELKPILMDEELK